MRAEVIAIGTELLLGQIVDTNSAWIGEQLALAGIDCHRHVRVGDNLDRIVEAVTEALGRADAVICCGGLGPTQDDLTREALARVTGSALVRDEGVAAHIRGLFAARNRPFPEINLRQADRPAACSIIPNPLGTAPGLECPVGDKVVYALPGVPYELQAMMRDHVLVDLRRRAGEDRVILSRTLRTWGESESGLAERLAGRIAELDTVGNPTLAFLASGIEGIRVRITASAPDPAAARALLDAEELRLRELLGELVFGVDDETMEQVVLRLLADRGLTLAVAESVTGGLLATRITDVPGASTVFRGGVVAYAPDVKFTHLGVPEGPVVTTAAAAAMAAGVRRLLGADVGLATTGVAGPDPAEGRPPGTVCVGWDVAGDRGATEIRLPGDRARVRALSVISVLNLLRLHLLGLR